MKKLFKFMFLFLLIFSLTGCLKRDTMEDISIYTTNYPTTYIAERLYGKFSDIKSIYPNGSNINDYSLTEKQIKDYSKGDLFIFNGLSKEKKYVTKMRRENRDLKIIDTTLYMEYSHDMSELWLDPSNFLMMAQNVKTGLREYIDSYYLNSKISSNYEKLKIEASNLDAKIKDIVSNADNKVIVTSNTLFKYLEKYGLTVYVLDENDSNIDITSNEVIKLFKNGDIKYIFIKNDEEENTLIKNFVSSYGATVQKWRTLSNISEIEASENQDYFSIMNDNLELLKNELYN
ncbi:MAG: zinc ABC transporter substrate-binding protein [Bacilli bacterium]|nr:zinc ABC transporter substrate-binding protein [Bacilli bacterium]